MHLASLETSRKGSIYLIPILIYGTTCLYWNLHCGKTARYIWNVFRQQIEINIAFHLIPRSYSAAADWVYGVLGIIDIRMYSCAIMPTLPHMARVVESKMQVSIYTGRAIYQNQNQVYATFSWCFQGRQMHKLPRLNGCGVSSERQYCLLSADEIFFNFNELFFGNMSLTKLLSWGDVLAWLPKNTS